MPDEKTAEQIAEEQKAAEEAAVRAAAEAAAKAAGESGGGADTERKEENRAAYEARKARETLTVVQKELDGYKRREEEARKEKLTTEQRIQEERDQLAAENERLKIERLQLRIAAEFKLPDALIPRLIGSDEDALRADAAELAKLLPKPRAGTTTDPSREGGMQPTFKRSQLRDPAFYRANEAAIKAAQAAGRISSD